MGKENFLGLTIPKFWGFHMSCAFQLYTQHSSTRCPLDALDRSHLYDPLLAGGNEIVFLGKFAEGEFDLEATDKEVLASLKNDRYGVFKVLWSQEWIREAYRVYSDLEFVLPEMIPMPESVPNLLILKQNLDEVRFVGEVAAYIAMWLYDDEYKEVLRKRVVHKSAYRDKFLGHPDNKGDGPLTKVIELLEAGYGLKSPYNTKQLLMLLRQLESEVTGSVKLPPIKKSEYSDVRKRFVLRVGSRYYSRFPESRTDVEKMVCFLLMCISEAEHYEQGKLSTDVKRIMKLVYEHKEDVLVNRVDVNDVNIMDP